MNSVIFITTGQPTTNPRLLKEVETLIYHGYRVRVICCFYQSWAQKFDQDIVSRYPDVFVYCGGDPRFDKITYLKTRIRQKISTAIWPYVRWGGIPENAVSRTHAEAVSLARQMKADIYIAHNLGALPAAVSAAKFNKSKVGYDAEDMNTAQFNNRENNLYRLNKYIEVKYFPDTGYFSAASPLIASNYQRIYPFLTPVVINNVFKKINLKLTAFTPGQPLKLFWFSQTTGQDRGLEMVIRAMKDVNGPVQLLLLGQCSAADRAALTALAGESGLGDGQLQFHEPVAPEELFYFAAQFHIGIASETAATLNRDICLTNKIFTYIQCGLAVLASDTKAQQLFMEQYPASGKVFEKNNAHSFSAQINAYLGNPELLHQTRISNYHLGQSALNWEKESALFLELVQSLLHE